MRGEVSNQETPLWSAAAMKVRGHAVVEAEQLKHAFITQEHLLLALLRCTEENVVAALRMTGLTYEDVRRVVRAVGRRNQRYPDTPPKWTPAALAVLKRATMEAVQRHASMVEPVHLLLSFNPKEHRFSTIWVNLDRDFPLGFPRNRDFSALVRQMIDGRGRNV